MTDCLIDTSEKREVSCVYTSRLLLGRGHHLEQHLLCYGAGQRSELAIPRVLEWPWSGYCALNALPSEHRGEAVAPGEMVVIQTMAFIVIAVHNSVWKSKRQSHIDCFPT